MPLPAISRYQPPIFNLILINPGKSPFLSLSGYIPNGFQVASRRQESDKFVGNEFAQPKAGQRSRGRSLSLIPGSIDNRLFIKTVTGVNERSQQRGNLKDEGYTNKKQYSRIFIMITRWDVGNNNGNNGNIKNYSLISGGLI
ncbi:conserved hypothetical protein [Xenorhabdus szentirmaii DSM 16338]|uniref:Uncharacterized protein n=1 Tax=Xenorhabdus szentirmaii DSM 16338 TaxID=1427518 RepID=W1J226_9GAMM|nr:conserved hypothetical protein [Xenorhabdus szentirmaii DSM 16338]